MVVWPCVDHIKRASIEVEKIIAVLHNGKRNSEPFHHHERPFSFSLWPCLRFRTTLHPWSSSQISRSFGWTTLGRTGDFGHLAESPPATLGRRDFGRLANYPGSTTWYSEHPSVWLGDYRGTTRSYTRLSKVKRSCCQFLLQWHKYGRNFHRESVLLTNFSLL